jgi:nitroimidazol reductase NimA-like FMN-containing flavoprotein (pyridoxamine 5'-phosphate oxidase superfamily)
MKAAAPSPRTKIRRLAKRGRYDRPTIEAVLDAGLVGHLAFTVEDQPYAMPMLYARAGDTLYLHGSRLSRLLTTARTGIPVCFTVTLVDGLVLARSAFHHSVNYRSAIVLGRAHLVAEESEKRAALDAIVEHVVPGRTQDARRPNAGELKATEVIALPIDEASAKVRTGGPVDAPEDYALPVWAGEIPLAVAVGAPVPDDRCEALVPDYIAALTRPAAEPGDGS